MQTIYTIKDLRIALGQREGKLIGLVPTMGYLHEGHLSLAKEAREENDLVVMSIFVNPLQFGPNEDFDHYPRDEEADHKAAEQAGIDILFIPSADEMYPEPMKLSMGFIKGADVLCGKSRPGHFDGVATVLTKLFNLISPDQAYFGLKDAQQFALVYTLIKELNFQINLIGLPTVRERDGLAKSSRNVNLTEAERKEASFLYECLDLGRRSIENGTDDSEKIERVVRGALQERITFADIEYVELRSFPLLEKLETINEQVIIAVAIQYDKARLIDNLIILPNGEKRDKITINLKD